MKDCMEQIEDLIEMLMEKGYSEEVIKKAEELLSLVSKERESEDIDTMNEETLKTMPMDKLEEKMMGKEGYEKEPNTGFIIKIGFKDKKLRG